MATKTSTEADRIADELAEAEARTNRLRAKAEAINTAVREERDRTELSHYRIKAPRSPPNTATAITPWWPNSKR